MDGQNPVSGQHGGSTGFCGSTVGALWGQYGAYLAPRSLHLSLELLLLHQPKNVDATSHMPSPLFTHAHHMRPAPTCSAHQPHPCLPSIGAPSDVQPRASTAWASPELATASRFSWMTAATCHGMGPSCEAAEQASTPQPTCIDSTAQCSPQCIHIGSGPPSHSAPATKNIIKFQSPRQPCVHMHVSSQSTLQRM